MKKRGAYWVWRMGFVPYGIKQKAWAPPWSIKGGGCLRGNPSVIPAVENGGLKGLSSLLLSDILIKLLLIIAQNLNNWYQSLGSLRIELGLVINESRI